MQVHNRFVNIVVVDDENDICEIVSGILTDDGYNTRCANCYVDAIALIEDKVPHIVIVDVWINESDRDGLRLLQYIKEKYPDVIVIMMSGHSTISTAVEAIKNGAYDFLEKPFDADRLLVSIAKALETAILKRENEKLKSKAQVTEHIVGESNNIKEIKKSIVQYAKVNTRCAIIAPRGANKEDIAKEIHDNSARHQAPFLAVNCLRCNPKQLEIDLYGSEIFINGSAQVTRGLFERASGGTLFIDNIDLMPLDLQSKLLNTFINNKFNRVGSKNNALAFNTRIIVGIIDDIESLLNNNAFNKELFYRVSINTITMLPLSQRVQDIPYIIQHYLDQVSKIYHLEQLTLSSEAIEILTLYKWPGDMLEVQYVVAYILSNIVVKNQSRNTIYANDLPPTILKTNNADRKVEVPLIAQVASLNMKEAREVFEKVYLNNQLKKHEGNVSKVARVIKMERSALYRKLKQLKIN